MLHSAVVMVFHQVRQQCLVADRLHRLMQAVLFGKLVQAIQIILGSIEMRTFQFIENAKQLSAMFIADPDGNRPAKLWSEIRGREMAVLLVLLAFLKIFASMTRRARQRWEEMQRRYEAFGASGSRFIASDLLKVQKPPKLGGYKDRKL